MILNETHRIECDEYNVILQRFRESTEKTKTVNGVKVGTGEYTKSAWENLGYYPNHRAALRGYANLELRNTPQNFFDLSAKIEELMMLIENIKEVIYE